MNANQNNLGNAAFTTVLAILSIVTTGLIFYYLELPRPILVLVSATTYLFLIGIAKWITKIEISNIFLWLFLIPAPILAIGVSYNDFLIGGDITSFIPVVYNVFVLSYCALAISYIIEYQFKNKIISSLGLLRIILSAFTVSVLFGYSIYQTSFLGINVNVILTLAATHLLFLFSALFFTGIARGYFALNKLSHSNAKQN